MWVNLKQTLKPLSLKALTSQFCGAMKDRARLCTNWQNFTGTLISSSVKSPFNSCRISFELKMMMIVSTWNLERLATCVERSSLTSKMRERRFVIKSSSAQCQPILLKKLCIDIVPWLLESFKGAKWGINMRMPLILGGLYPLSREHRLFSNLKLRSKLLDSLSNKQKKKSRTSSSFTCKLQQKNLTLFLKTLSKINSMINSDRLRKK